MDVFQDFGDVGIVVGVDVGRLARDDVGRFDDNVFPARFRGADLPVDKFGYVVAALLDGLVERRKVRRRELADGFVVVDAQDGNVVRNAEIPPPSICMHASVIWYAWLSSQAMIATGLGSDWSQMMSWVES